MFVIKRLKDDVILHPAVVKVWNCRQLVVHWPPVCIGDTCRTYVNVTFVALVVRAILVIVTKLLRLLSLSQERKIMYCNEVTI